MDEVSLRESLGLQSYEEIAQNILDKKIDLKELYRRGLNPVFRLHPPKRGFSGSVKKPYGHPWVKVKSLEIRPLRGFVGVLGYNPLRVSFRQKAL